MGSARPTRVCHATSVIPETLLAQARAGDAAALGQLLELYRNYLRLMARSLIGQPLRAPARCLRPGAGDLPEGPPRVRRFLGSTEPELVAWLRQILVRTPGRPGQAPPAPRGATTAARSRWRCCSTARAWRSSRRWPRRCRRPASTPSRREQAVLLADALEKLPADYREVFLLRNLEHIPFDEIAVADGPIARARCAMLWTRAISKLEPVAGGGPP